MKCMEEAHSYLEKCVQKKKIPGAAFAVVTNQEVFSDFLGNRCLIPSVQPVQKDTVYDLASLTKVICTTTLALQLMEKGAFSLQTRVSSILSGFPYEEIIIGHLLTHTSGMKPDDKRYRSCQSKDEMYQFLISLPLDHPPGQHCCYSDFGFITMGRIIETITGRTLDNCGYERIFQPLGMKDTCFCPGAHGLKERCAATEEEEGRGMICGIVHDGKAWRMGGVSGHAGLFSTVDDLSRFVQMMLGRGERDGVRILSPASFRLLEHYRTSGMEQYRTIGWFADDHVHASCGDFCSQDCLYHTGFAGGSVYIDFERKMGIILLTNAVHPKRGRTDMQALRNGFHNVVLSSFDEELL